MSVQFSSPAEISPAAAVLSPQQPWPGLAAYDEQSQEYFCGRQEESATLLRLVLQSPLTVLYGKSGLGKTSLLKAGLFPLLRKELDLSRGERYLPIYVRLTLSSTKAEPVLNQVKTILKDELERVEAEFPPMLMDETLWEYLHRRDLEIWGPENFLISPVFVLDQFEELFSKGAGSAGRTEETFRDLADLVANTIPKSLDETSAGSKRGRLDLLSHRYRIILSFREDFLPQMKDWEHQVPSLLRYYLHLQAMTAATAIQAVERAGVAVLEPGVAARIVDAIQAKTSAWCSDTQRCPWSGSSVKTQRGIRCARIRAAAIGTLESLLPIQRRDGAEMAARSTCQGLEKMARSVFGPTVPGRRPSLKLPRMRWRTSDRPISRLSGRAARQVVSLPASRGACARLHRNARMAVETVRGRVGSTVKHSRCRRGSDGPSPASTIGPTGLTSASAVTRRERHAATAAATRMHPSLCIALQLTPLRPARRLPVIHR